MSRNLSKHNKKIDIFYVLQDDILIEISCYAISMFTLTRNKPTNKKIARNFRMSDEN